MTDDELAEIQNRVNAAFLVNIKNASGPDSLVLDWKDTTILSLIAEVRRQRDENRAMQSRLDIAEGRVEGMKNL